MCVTLITAWTHRDESGMSRPPSSPGLVITKMLSWNLCSSESKSFFYLVPWSCVQGANITAVPLTSWTFHSSWLAALPPRLWAQVVLWAEKAVVATLRKACHQISLPLPWPLVLASDLMIAPSLLPAIPKEFDFPRWNNCSTAVCP